MEERYMKRTVTAICVAVCLMISLLAISSAQAVNSAKQAELLASCQKIQQYLTLPPETSAEQCALVALDIAVGQSQPLDESVDIAEVLRQASAFTTYGVLSDTFYTWVSGNWVGNHRSTYTYSGIRQTGETVQDWDSDSAKWLNSSRTLTTYTAGGTLSMMTEQMWSSDDNDWLNMYLISFRYSGGICDTMLMQSWGGTDWVNSTRSLIVYSGGKMATDTTQHWQSSAWVDFMKTDYTYTGSNVTESLTQMYVGVWMNSSKVIYTYNASNLKTQEVHQMGAGTLWNNSSKYDYTYNGSGHEILRISSDWVVSAWNATEADTSKWSGDDEIEMVHNHFVDGWVSRTQFSYDASHNGILDLSQEWLGGSWENTSRAVYVYAVLAVEVDNGRVPSVFELSQNYPNPFNPLTVIRYSLSRRSPVEIAVFNVLGQEVKRLENSLQPAGVYETTWDGTNRTGEKVASGIYFYRIKAGDNVETRKMLLLK
jgi:hypothetical protein